MSFSAAELIEAVQRKLRLTSRRSHPSGEFPPGWKEWFGSISQRVGAITGASAAAIVTVFLERPLATPPRRLAAMTRWQAFSAVWRQHGHEEFRREQRGLRWTAGALSALAHVILGGALLWLLYGPARVDSPPPAGETVVQVEYIGEGTPEEIGGDPQPQVEPPVEAVPEFSDVVEPPLTTSAAAEAVPAEPVVAQAALTTAPQAMPPPEAVPDVVVPSEAPTPPAPAAEQPLAVSEPAPDTTEAFFLPRATPRIVERIADLPELVAPAPSVRSRDVPEPFQASAIASRTIAQNPSPLPVLPQRVPEVEVRDVPEPLSRVILRELPPRPADAREIRAAVPEVRERAIPAPAPPQLTARVPAAAAASSSPRTPATGGVPARPAAAAPRAATAAASTSGPRRESAPGGWATPRRADDWGDAARNQPGAQRGERPGIYDSDGTVRLAETPGSASPAQPPGTITDEITDLDRSGTWLKRKPTDYEPTAFDQFWRPSETLLEEWVRRSVTTVRIPIPGTNKYVVCQTVLIALGGGCGITDPNLNDQPATARPPPDIPFKPELQEDNGSVRPGG